MDDLYLRSKPFVFITDFEAKRIRLFDINQKEILFAFPDYSNHIDTNSNSEISFLIDSISFSEYKNQFDQALKELKRGNSFLLNLSSKTKLKTEAALLDMYQQSSAKYKFYLEDEFCFFSPETFIQIESGVIKTFPMKGTIDASVPNAEQIILNDAKEKQEHATIVDLLRNDLSIVASKVSVEEYRYIDTLITNRKKLLQVSSKIIGVIKPTYQKSISKILKAILPAGSISGAPKTKTVDIIKRIESTNRGYYTGICGYFDGQKLDTAVMIRFIEKDKGLLHYRSGGGITYQSNARNEYQEMLDKIYVPISRNNMRPERTDSTVSYS